MLAATFLLALAANAAAVPSRITSTSGDTSISVSRALALARDQPESLAVTAAHLAAEQTAWSADEESSSSSSKKEKTRTSKHGTLSKAPKSSTKADDKEMSSSPSPTSSPRTTSKADAKAPSTRVLPTSNQPANDVGGTQVVYVTSPGPPTQTGIDNGAVIIFPRAVNYWVIKEVAVIQWEPPLERPANIRLTNEDRSLLAREFYLAKDVPVGFRQMAYSIFDQAKPGSGYILAMADVNGTLISESEPFELKAFGASPIIPAPFTAETPAQYAVYDSGAIRVQKAGTWLSVGAVVAGAVAGGMTVYTWT